MTENLNLFDPSELPPEVAEVTETEIKRVFTEWQEVMGYPTRKLSPKRRTLIRGRLRKFSADQLVQAIRVAASLPFWRGQNNRNTPYDDILNIFRNDERVEMFISQSNNITRMLPSKDYKTEDF